MFDELTWQQQPTATWLVWLTLSVSSTPLFLNVWYSLFLSSSGDNASSLAEDITVECCFLGPERRITKVDNRTVKLTWWATEQNRQFSTTFKVFLPGVRLLSLCRLNAWYHKHLKKRIIKLYTSLTTRQRLSVPFEETCLWHLNPSTEILVPGSPTVMT